MMRLFGFTLFFAVSAGYAYSQDKVGNESLLIKKKEIPVEFSLLEAKDGMQKTSIVHVQGVKGSPLSKYCGSNGENCKCEVDINGSKKGYPITAISELHNFASCSVSEFGNAAAYLSVRLKGKRSASKILPIQSQVTLAQILNGEDKNKVRKIMRYSCTKSFVEGEYVSTSSIACGAGQHLGFIFADYDYYLYQSQLDNNLMMKGGDEAWPNLCNFFRAPLRVDCGGSVPEVRFGLYREGTDTFTVGVVLSSSSYAGGTVYGYAAIPDSAGNCPLGTEKIRPAIAQPASMVFPTNCLPSNFVNTSNALNNSIVENLETILSKRFTVRRQPSIGFEQCNDQLRDENSASMCRQSATTSLGVGDCSKLQLGEIYNAQDIGYQALTPVVCAIPKELLSGL